MFTSLDEYSFTILNVGLDISSSSPKKFKNPSVNFVLPEPSSPVKTMVSPLVKYFAKIFAMFIVWLLDVDFILIDCPAGIEQGFKNAIAGADRAIVVTNAEISSIRDADRIIGLLEASEIKNPELIVNRLRPNMVRKGEMMDVDDIVDLLSINLIGVVPDDEFIITQTNKGEPAVINKKAPSGRAYLEIARRILGENIDVTIPGKDEGFFSKLKHIFRK